MLERVLRRQWNPEDGPPEPSLIAAVDRLAMLPLHIGSRLADELDGIWLGAGNVPDLDDLAHLRGEPVRPDSRALWDDVPGAFIGRTIVVGTGRHVSVSLLDHEIGHALEQLDGMADQKDWQTIMFRCRPLLDDRYQDPYEWWAEAYALCATGQISQLTRTLSGSASVTEMVWAYYRYQYGLEARRR